MHILESYALQNDLKIDLPEVYEKYFPLAVDKFITLDTSSLGTDAMAYNHWSIVLESLAPRLDKEGIKIVQLGPKGCEPIPGCYITVGQCDFNQRSYIIKKSLLHLSVNNESSHVASGFGKKMVVVFPRNCYVGQFKPYWSKSEDITILQGESSLKRPSYNPSESPKSINTVKPEEITKAVLKKLNLFDESDPEWQYKTLKIGASYNRRRIESNLSHLIDPNKMGISSIIVRMDLNFNEDNLIEQLKQGPCSIITNRALSDEVINNYSKNILELVYYITDDHSPEFVKKLKSKSIKYILRSRSSSEELNDFKLDYLDHGVITEVPIRTQDDFEELKGKSNLLYKSNYFIVHDRKFYPNTAALLRLKQGTETLNHPIQEVIDDPYFWEDEEHYHILIKND
jgi:hypothetical protein